MSQSNNGGPAFPVPPPAPDLSGDPGSTISAERGMTLRDFFAAQAVVAVCDRLSSPGSFAEIVAQDSYRIADAMLAERAKAKPA